MKVNSSTNWQSAGAQGTLDRGSTVLGTVTATAAGICNIVLNAAGLAVVQGWVNNPATNFGFIIQDYANTTADDLIFSSRETTIAANRPQLILVYNPPSSAPLSQGAALATASGTVIGDQFVWMPTATGTGGPTSVEAKLTQPNSGSLSTNTAVKSTEHLLAIAGANDRSRPTRVDYSPAERAAVVDAALAEMHQGWPKTLAEI